MNPSSVTYGTALIIAIVCIIIGFAAGGFIGISNKNRRKKNDDEATAITPVVPSMSQLVDPAKYIELLRLWREKEGTGLFVETSGHLLASSEPLNDRQRKRFIDLIKELADWLNIPPAIISEKIADPSPTDIEVHVAESSGVQKIQVDNSESQSVVPERSASVPVKTSPVPPAIPKPAINENLIQPQNPPSPITYSPLPVVPKPITKPVVESVQKPVTSMVQQIDDILQEVVLNSDKPDRKIRLVEEPKEGVIVWVEHEHYIGIDAVPDPIVKDLIRAAVKEWDRRTEAHL